MVDVLDTEPLLENVHAGPAPRWADRPLTRFERRGLDAGRSITDLTYRRRLTHRRGPRSRTRSASSRASRASSRRRRSATTAASTASGC